ncbi:PTS sugar transporter subunit IIA [Mollicutes bacterium LVI A0075]|nr:PTS sugar transporter subunit IIA [Mollicutes bacterium LVI A0075]
MLTSLEYILNIDSVSKRNEVFTAIATNLSKNGVDVNTDEVVSKLIEREEMSSTGFEAGIAIPHAKVTGLDKPMITVVRTNDLYWPSMGGEPTNLIINILSQLMVAMITYKF